MSPPSLCVVSTGGANLASVAAAFSRLGHEVTLASDAAQIEQSGRVLLPGVGAFGPAMQILKQSGWAEALRARIQLGRPTLAICLGLQLLFESSEEAPGVPGLGVLPGKVSAFDGVQSPQLGWNRVQAPQGSLVHSGYAAYANSYRASAAPTEWRPSWTTHGLPFVASVERGAVLACQFHPELSGPWGSALLRRWLEATC